MPKVSVSAEASAGPDKVWTLLTDPTRYPEWFATHDAFVGDVPGTLTEGTTFKQRVKSMGMPVETAWRVTAAEAPQRLELAGDGPMGVKVRSVYVIESVAAGSVITYDTEFSGGMLAGPMGEMVAKQAREAAGKSLAKLAELAS
jgi:uncharacterized protein YndB with AHSA1/START domain